MSVTSWSRSTSMIRPISVWPPTRSSVLCVPSVRGRMRLPYPAARMRAFIVASAGARAPDDDVLRKTRTTPGAGETDAPREAASHVCSHLPTLGTNGLEAVEQAGGFAPEERFDLVP